MSESLLKREFQKSDVQRCRNLIAGQYGNSTQILVGYEKQESFHKEGDVWEEGGKSWTIKNGLRRSIPKLTKAKQYCQVPLACPHCGKAMSSRLDKKMYTIHGVCADCVTRMEDDLKRAGMYRQYENQLILGNVDSFVKELESRIEAAVSDVDTKIATEDGLVEDWGRLSDGLVKSLKEWKDMLCERLSPKGSQGDTKEN